MGTLGVGLLMLSSVYSCVHAHVPQVQWAGRRWATRSYTFKGRVKGPFHNTTKRLFFFGIFDDGVFGQCEMNCFFGITHLRVPKWEDFYIVRCSECSEIFGVEFATKP